VLLPGVVVVAVADVEDGDKQEIACDLPILG